jgi:serine-type D-Ala-D-Ala carboxypeptidase
VRYSDLGLMLLGEACRRLHGADDLAEVIAARVTRPLGLTSTVFNPVTEHGIPRENIAPTELDPDWRGRRVWGEVHDENACGVGGVAGHAGLFSTARDVAMFGEAWLRRDPRLGIDPALMDDAVRVHVDDNGQRRGLGWVIRALEDSSASERFSENTYGHTGFTGTTLWIDPQRELVVSCLTNRVYPGRHKEGIHEFRRALHALLAETADAL